MKKNMIGILLLTLLVTGLTGATSNKFIQNDLLAEYEQKLVLIEKQFTDYKKQIDPQKMSTMDVKMKIGGFENQRNTLKAKLRDLRKAGNPLNETDKGDLDKNFDSLTKQFEELKKVAG